MNKQLLILFSIFSIALLSSCKEDEPAPPHEVGEWSLREFAIINVPSAYSYQEATIYNLSDTQISSHTMSIKNDGTYSRAWSFKDGSKTDDSGSWELNEDTFFFNSDNIGLSEEYEVSKNENSKLWLTESSNVFLVKNAILDTITQEYINSTTDAEYEALFDNVTVDFVSVFEK